MRDNEPWSQQELAEKVGMTQNRISLLENPYKAKPTLTTLKRIAAAFDVALVVRFVPFSELVKWVTGTPYEERGLSRSSMAIPGFEREDIESLAALAKLSELAISSENQSDERQPRLGKFESRLKYAEQHSSRSHQIGA
jgi:transcriptional regulator with XRE-family HTH domain